MEQIRNYVEAMFSSLPQTAEVKNIKLNMLENLEEKYNALLAEGKNSYEATGIILSTVGTADELRTELCSRQEAFEQEFSQQESPGHTEEVLNSRVRQEFPHTQQQLLEYSSFKRKYNISIACAIGLFILSPAVHIMLPQINGRAFSYLPMFLMIAAGVGLCIYWDHCADYYVKALGFRTKRNTAFVPADDPILEQYKKFKSRQGLMVSLAVGLFILSPAIYMFGEEVTNSNRGGVLAMFLSIAIGVALCILSESNEDYYKEIFSYGLRFPFAKCEDFRSTILFGTIAFSLATMLYLYLGFIKNLWHPGWIVFPFCALLTGICFVIESYITTGKTPEA